MGDLLNGMPRKKKKSGPPERVDDILAMFEREDFIRQLYRDTGDQSWRNRTRRGRAVDER